MGREGDEIFLDNQGLAKATPTKRKGVVKDFWDTGYHSVISK